MPAALRASGYLSACSLILACGSTWLTAVNEHGDRIPLRIVENLRQPDSSQTPVTIESASISGDTLHLQIVYAGGCGRHELGLAASSRLVESDPPQVTVVLHHDGHGDTCRAGYDPNVIVDLQPLQRIAGDHNTLRIQLYEPWAVGPIDRQLVYRF